jgi:hypothetical protein
MSDTTLLGVLRMPIGLWQDSPLDKIQRHSCYLQAADRIEAQKQRIEELESALKKYIKAGCMTGTHYALQKAALDNALEVLKFQ